MTKRIIAIIAAAGLLAWGCNTVEEDSLVPEENVSGEVVDSAIIPGEIIVELSDELVEQLEADFARGLFLQTKSSAVNSVFQSIGATSVERLYEDGGEWEPRHREAGLHKWYRIKFDPELPQTKAQSSLDDIPGIVYTEPVRRVAAAATMNDPYFGRQWHYYNSGTLTNKHKAGCDINVVPVWERYTGGSNNVIVSVVDGGIDLSHEDLAAVCMPGGANGSKNFVTGGYQIVPHSHGTHVAGTIGAINNNGIGCCGIAGGLDGKGGVTLMSCQVFQDNPDDPDHDLTGNFYDAIVWGADHGAVISQNSWGNVYENEEAAKKGGVGSIKGAIDYFIKYAGIDANGNQTGPMKGGVVIFAAGNEGWSIGWPAAYDKVIAVGALAPDYTRAYYSNYGDWVDIAAPGGSAYYDKGEVFSTVPGNKYDWSQGTSMACPHVSGVAALLVSHYGGLGFTNDMLVERLLKGANPDKLSSATKLGPLLDAFGSFSYGSGTAPDAPSSHTVTATSNFLNYEWKVTSDADDWKAYGYLLMATKDEQSLKNVNPLKPSADIHTAVVEVGRLDVGDSISGTVSGLEFSTEYYTAISAYDYSKNYSKISPIVKVSTMPNQPPVINPAGGDNEIVVKAHETATVDIEIYEPDGHSFTVDFAPGSDAAKNTLQPSGLYRLTVTGKDADEGKYQAVYTVTDSFGASASRSFAYEILPNHPPVPASNPENLIFTDMGQKKTLDMSEYVYDPDGEQLKFEISSTPVGIVHLNQVENKLNLTTLDFGLASVTITGKDVKGEKATLALKVLVRDPESDPDVYPTQVTDYLNVSDGEEKSISVSISNASGALLYSGSVTCDAFSPAKIDMSKWAPGRYGVVVVSGAKTFKTTVVKI